MKRDGLDDYREGIFWLMGGGAFAVMGLAEIGWLGIQKWYLYAWGLGLLIVAAILSPRHITPDRLRRGWLPLLIALVASGVLAAVSAEVGFVAIFPLVAGLLWIGAGLWLMFRRDVLAEGGHR